MNDETKVRELFQDVLARPIDVDGKYFKVDRAKIVANLLRAPLHVEVTRLNPWRNTAVWGLAAGLALLAGSAAWLARGTAPGATALGPSLTVDGVRGTVTRLEGNASFALAPGGAPAAMSAASELVTAAGARVNVRNAQGLKLELSENSRLGLVGLESEAASSVRLFAGALRCQVPALERNQTFSVVTPDATIAVQGTAFSVLVSGILSAAQAGAGPGPATRTCVRVEEGTVLVKTVTESQRLSAGQTWGCDPGREPSEAEASPGLQPPASAERAPSEAKARGQGQGRSSGGVRGTLEAENGLFQAGLSAERAGQPSDARVHFEQLLARYPGSPLAGEARAALVRLNGVSSTPR